MLSASDTQKEEELQNKNNSRERLIREERLEEYNARIESKISQTGDSNDKKFTTNDMLNKHEMDFY